VRPKHGDGLRGQGDRAATAFRFRWLDAQARLGFLNAPFDSERSGVQVYIAPLEP
jgi:hypothetical protein